MPCAKKAPAWSETDAELRAGAAVTHRLESAAHEVRQFALRVDSDAESLTVRKKRPQLDHGGARGGGGGQAAARVQRAGLGFAHLVHGSWLRSVGEQRRQREALWLIS
jgi:hypothetical protein